MTTKAEQVFDAVVAGVAAVLTSAVRIPNPLELEASPGVILQNGYGVSVGPAGDPDDESLPILAETREFGVTLTRLVAATDSDAAAMATTQKQLLADMYAVKKKLLHTSATLGSICNVLGFNGDTGVEQLATLDGTGRYFVLSAVFRVRYAENVS